MPFLSALPAVADGEEEDDEEIPAGFENIDQPRTTSVEIWFEGTLRGTVSATFTSGWLRFLQPEKVAALVPGLVNASVVIKALQGELSAHKQYLCRTPQQQDCGRLKPTVAGVIFDASYFRADLFIAPEQLKIRTPKLSRYLGKSTSNTFSAVQGLSLSVSGARANDSNDHYSWYGRSVASLAEQHLFADWSYDKDSHFNLASLYIEEDWQGKELVGGLFSGRSFGLGFSGDPQLLGLRIAHSTQSMNSSVSLNTTPIVVYLPVRGRVEVYRNGKLLDARILESGRQQLDTRGFPQGAYNLTIKVYDGAQVVNEKQQLFVKSNVLPGIDDPLYFLEVGQPMVSTEQKWWPRTGQGLVGRGGYSQLINKQTGLTLAATIENSDALAEAEIVRLQDNLEWSAGMMIARQNRTGVFGNLFWQWREWQLQAQYRELSSKSANDKSALLGDGFRTAQVSTSVAWGDASFTIGRDWQWDQGDPNTNLTDYIRGEWTLLKDSSYDLRFGLDASRSFGLAEKSGQILASLKLSQRSDNRTLSIQRQWQKTRNGSQHDIAQIDYAKASWDNLKVANQDVTANTFIEHQRQQLAVGGEASMAGRWGSGHMSVNRVMPHGGDNVTSYVASLNSSLLAEPNAIAVGGRRLNDSAVIVDLNGQTTDDSSTGKTFDILVDGKRIGQGQVGDQIPVVLPPFKSYALSIRPAAENFAAFDDRLRKVTLYPGNVVPVSFDIVELETVLARIQNDRGEALVDAVISNSYEQSLTDGYGLFQGRLLPTIDTLNVTLSNGETCTVTLPETRRKRRGIIMLGTLICR